MWALRGNSTIKPDDDEEFTGDSNRSITADDLKLMHYLDMCIKEAMRLFSPVPMVQRAVVHDDMLIGDQVVPKGGVAMIAQVLIHHNNTVRSQHVGKCTLAGLSEQRQLQPGQLPARDGGQPSSI